MPARVGNLGVRRDTADAHKATVRWAPARGAEFYVVRPGDRPNLMNQNYQVYDKQTSVSANLYAGVGYCFTVDTVNENGITRGGRPPAWSKA